MGLLMDMLSHPSELLAMVSFKLFRSSAVVNPAVASDGSVCDQPRYVCYDLLNATSRSFATVIKELDEELMDPVCLFYVILRALDTVEDDMSVPKERKMDVLRHFHEYIFQKGWNFTESSPAEKDRRVLQEFDTVIEHFLTIKPKYQKVIADITNRMGNGMADFCEKRVVTKEDYDLYCHYVAGLVGVGLSEMFAVSGLESPAFAERAELSNSMGLFLQKTNIIRDFLEDHIDGRLFWPRAVWSQYAEDPEEFCHPQNIQKALACLNHLCLDAFQHIPDVIEYMSMIKNRSIFNFCAIPQVMAISTLALVFNNPNVFRGNVKIRKGQALKLILEADSVEMLRGMFFDFLDEIARKNVNAADPHFIEVGTFVARTKAQLVPSGHWKRPMSSYDLWGSLLYPVAIGVAAYLAIY